MTLTSEGLKASRAKRSRIRIEYQTRVKVISRPRTAHLPSYHVKFQCSKVGSGTLKNLAAVSDFSPFFATVKVKFGSGLPPFAWLPLTGAWTSRRMSKYCPARKSVLGRKSAWSTCSSRLHVAPTDQEERRIPDSDILPDAGKSVPPCGQTAAKLRWQPVVL